MPDRHEFLRYPDGGVADVPFDELVERIAAILREERPDVVITFGPDGVTGHPDHITVGSGDDRGVPPLPADGGDGFRGCCTRRIPSSMIERFNEELVASGKEPIDPTQPFQPRGVPDETIGVNVDCSSVVDRKRAAIREHRTQANDFSDELEDEVFRHEPHVIGWPERPLGSDALGDVFEGLD